MLFREVKRVLKKTGSLWLNIGDTYAGSHGSKHDAEYEKKEVFSMPYEYRVTRKVHGYQSKCLIGDTLILGDNKELKDYKVGNMVLTPSGLQSVTGVMRRKCEQLVEIKGEGLLPIYASPDHPFLVIEGNDENTHLSFNNDLKWIEASNLIVKRRHARGHFLLLPRIKGEEYKEVSLREFINPNADKPYHGPLFLKLDEETAWIMGLYVAEGSTSGNAISFALGQKEEELINKVLAWASKQGYNTRIDKKEGGVQIYVNSVLLKRAFTQWFGKGAVNKKVPNFILLNNDENIVRSFIDGYFSGDGTKLYKRSREIRVAKTSSKILALQMQLLFARLGVFAHITEVKRKREVIFPSGKKAWQRNAYHISYYPEGNIRKAYRIFPNYIAVPLRKKKVIPFQGYVYNLETSDGTFLASNVIVHNCLMGIPWRVAFALIDDGWILRNAIIWHKPNAMPSSVKDRLTQTYEYIFHFVKSRKYYYCLGNIREPIKTVSLERWSRALMQSRNSVVKLRRKTLETTGVTVSSMVPRWFEYTKHDLAVGRVGGFSYTDPLHVREYHPLGKNPGDTFTIPKHSKFLELNVNTASPAARALKTLQSGKLTTHVKKRILDVGAYLKSKLRESGLTVGKLSELTGVKKTTLEHYFRTDFSGQALPDRETWNILKPILGLGEYDEYISEEIRNALPQPHPLGRNIGDFWSIATRPLKEAHFAPFPYELPLRPILASCPPDGIVLDPLAGSGTVALTCEMINRGMWDKFRIYVNDIAKGIKWNLKWILIEINPRYCEIARRRLEPFVNQRRLEFET
jgi:DNA modification methylase/intein/homing endonuclease